MPSIRRVLLALLVISLASPLFGQPESAANSSVSAQITGKQGPTDPNEFHGSMILEAPFLPADPNLRINDWFSSKEYAQLKVYQCDRIRITLFEFRVKKPDKNGRLPITMRVWFQSPDQNHDKMVNLTLEVHNGDTVVGTVKQSIKVEEGDHIHRELRVLLSPDDLILDPITQLRITVTTRDV
jgi:hypothetical protein